MTSLSCEIMSGPPELPWLKAPFTTICLTALPFDVSSRYPDTYPTLSKGEIPLYPKGYPHVDTVVPGAGPSFAANFSPLLNFSAGTSSARSRPASRIMRENFTCLFAVLIPTRVCSLHVATTWRLVTMMPLSKRNPEPNPTFGHAIKYIAFRDLRCFGPAASSTNPALTAVGTVTGVCGKAGSPRMRPRNPSNTFLVKPFILVFIEHLYAVERGSWQDLQINWIGLKPFFDQASNTQPRHRMFLPRFHQALDVLCEDIALDVYGVARLERREIRVFVGEGDDGSFDDAVVPAGDGQADAVEGDRAFHRDVSREFFGHANAEPPVRAFGFEARHAADPVHVALHEMSAQFFHRCQGTFEIDARAGLHFAETRPPKRFTGKIGREALA